MEPEAKAKLDEICKKLDAIMMALRALGAPPSPAAKPVPEARAASAVTKLFDAAERLRLLYGKETGQRGGAPRGETNRLLMDYLEQEAWSEERIGRAFKRYAMSLGPERQFAFGLKRFLEDGLLEVWDREVPIVERGTSSLYRHDEERDRALEEAMRAAAEDGSAR